MRVLDYVLVLVQEDVTDVVELVLAAALRLVREVAVIRVAEDAEPLVLVVGLHVLLFAVDALAVVNLVRHAQDVTEDVRDVPAVAVVDVQQLAVQLVLTDAVIFAPVVVVLNVQLAAVEVVLIVLAVLVVAVVVLLVAVRVVAVAVMDAKVVVVQTVQVVVVLVVQVHVLVVVLATVQVLAEDVLDALVVMVLAETDVAVHVP